MEDVKTSTCPFLHGTVDAKPFPGYVHGKKPAICPNGCEPSMEVGKDETVEQTLLREALEYQDLYHHEMKSTDAVREARKAEIFREVKKTGTYKQTFDELQHGMRVAWRNAPKCANRKFWKEIQLLDCRDIKTCAQRRSPHPRPNEDSRLATRDATSGIPRAC